MENLNIKKVWFLISIISLITACEEQILDKPPEDIFVEEDVWNDIDLIEQFQNKIYEGLDSWNVEGHGSVMLASYTSDAMSAENLGSVYDINAGGIEADNIGAVDIWGAKYEYIRMANIFLSKSEEIEEDVVMNGEERLNELIGEVKFLRAQFYFDLLKNYGGVPLITEVFNLDDDFQKTREDYEVIVDWIIDELDEAIEILPMKRDDEGYGRIDKIICNATKAEVLLHANSELHKPSVEPSGPLFDYTKNTWQEVAQAAEIVISQFGDLQEVKDWEEYHKLLIEPNDEIIFPELFSIEFPKKTAINTVNGLPKLGGWMETQASQGLVDEYEMINGKRIDESGSGYDDSSENIYKNRDLRFYANFNYINREWMGTALDLAQPDGYDVSLKFTTTGYPVRKFTDENIAVSEETAVWPRLRLTTMYLIYAEAQFQLDNEDKARDYINRVRNRVGLPDINSSGDELFKDIQHERRVELSFEGYRFFDVRRWMIAPETENLPLEGIEWQKIDESGSNSDPNNLNYSIKQFQEREFSERFYYLPIPKTEMDRTDELEQNPGY